MQIFFLKYTQENFRKSKLFHQYLKNLLISSGLLIDTMFHWLKRHPVAVDFSFFHSCLQSMPLVYSVPLCYSFRSHFMNEVVVLIQRILCFGSNMVCCLITSGCRRSVPNGVSYLWIKYVVLSCFLQLLILGLRLQLFVTNRLLCSFQFPFLHLLFGQQLHNFWEQDNNSGQLYLLPFWTSLDDSNADG